MGYPSRLMKHRPPTPPSGIPGWLPPAAIAVFAVLRATGKSGVLALLALPLMYNRAFFWGFFNFNLALGMSLVAFALLARSLTSFPYELVYADPPRGSIAAPMTRTASEGEWG